MVQTFGSIALFKFTVVLTEPFGGSMLARAPADGSEALS